MFIQSSMFYSSRPIIDEPELTNNELESDQSDISEDEIIKKIDDISDNSLNLYFIFFSK